MTQYFLLVFVLVVADVLAQIRSCRFLLWTKITLYTFRDYPVSVHYSFTMPIESPGLHNAIHESR